MEKWGLFVDFVLIGGMAILSLFIVFILKSKTQFSKKLLVVFFISSVFFLLYYYGYLHRLRVIGAIAILFGNGAGFLLGPVLLFYIKSLVQKKQKILNSLYLHLIPFYLFWILVSLPVSLSLGANIFRTYHESYLFIADYINLVENIYFMIYAVYSLRLARQINKVYKESYSNLEKGNLKWAEYLIIGLMAIIFLDSLFSIYELIFPVISWNIGTIIAFLFVAFYLVLGYKGMFQANILLPEFLFSETLINETQEKLKEQKLIRQLDTLSEMEIRQLKKKLHTLLEQEKIYLNDTLSLLDLSRKLGISDKKLSELLNQHLNVSFYNFINEYRVAEVKRRLQSGDNEKYTLLGIAFESGFQSKASFNRVFKQKTGMSPSKYRKSLAASTSE